MCVMLSIRMARSSVYADVVIVFWHVGAFTVGVPLFGV